MVIRMNISYNSYRIFYYAAKFQNFTCAANFLMSNQPNVTRTIRNLENELGCQLFIRSNRGIKLTPEGQKLYTHVALAIEHIQIAEEEIMTDQSLESGIVTIATGGIALRCCMLPVLREYRRKYPGVRIRVSNSSSLLSMQTLQEGLADLAMVIASEHIPKTLKQRMVTTIREVPVCGEAFSFLCEKPCSLEELTRYPLVGLNQNTISFSFYSKYFAARQLPFQLAIEVAASDQILPIVQNNLGIGFIPEDFLKEAAPSPPVYKIPLKDPLPLRSICLLRRENQILNAAARELERMIFQDNAISNAKISPA